MHVVLPGALPPPREARELIPHIEKSAPTLVHWFRRCRAVSTPADPVATGCTPWEVWQLQACGFAPGKAQNFATGLGPLYADFAPASADTPVWLAELVHISPSRDGAALLPAGELDIHQEHSVALFDSVKALFDDAGFDLAPCSPVHWRVTLPPGCTLPSTSPALVAQTSVNDWWPQTAPSRAWRKLVNEIQMLWFDHPVNQERFAQQLLPVNSLWLFGGASPGQFTQQPAQVSPATGTRLLQAANRQDWGLWLQELAALEQAQFQGRPQPSRVVLTGPDRIVTLTPAPTARLLGWTPWRQNDWRRWWSPPD